MIKVIYLHVGAELYGSDKVLLELVTGLDKSKFEPIVVLPEEGPLLEQLKINNVKTYVVPYPILRRKYFNLRGIYQYISTFVSKTKEVAEIAKKEKIDVIHTNTIAVFEGAYLKRLIKKPNLWHVHEIITTPRFMNWLTSFMVGRFSDKIISISNATKENLGKSKFVSNKNIQVIYNGISLDEIQPIGDLRTELSIANDHLVFGHVGRVNAWKGQQDFLSAAIPLMKKHLNIELVLSGNAYKGQEWREQDLVRFVSQYPEVKDRIHFLGYRSDVGKVFNTMDVFVTCSTRPEPFSMVTIEAMAHEKPVIAYNAAGPGEIVQEGVSGKLVKANDINSLRDAMTYYVNNPNAISIQGTNAYRRVKNTFSEDEFIRSFQKAYNQLSN